MSSDAIEVVDSGEVEYVPDGDPCPKHGLPTRLLFTSTGLFSQCQGCRDAFLDWFSSHTKDVVRNAVVVPPPPSPIVLRAKPVPPQIGLPL